MNYNRHVRHQKIMTKNKQAESIPEWAAKLMSAICAGLPTAEAEEWAVQFYAAAAIERPDWRLIWHRITIDRMERLLASRAPEMLKSLARQGIDYHRAELCKSDECLATSEIVADEVAENACWVALYGSASSPDGTEHAAWRAEGDSLLRAIRDGRRRNMEPEGGK